MPEPITRAEDAGLYVLDLLDPEAKRAFEVELAGSPELQRQVRELQGNLEALAVATPPRIPPARVWAGIAKRTAKAAPKEALPTVFPWRQVWRWLANGWAVAAVLAVAFLVQWSWGPRSVLSARNQQVGNQEATGEVGPDEARGRDVRRLGVADGAGRRIPETRGGETALRNSDVEAARLRDRVRLLSDQVALLTHVLTQRAMVPAGAARLQVFRLYGTNLASELSGVAGVDPRPLVPSGPSPSVPVSPTTPEVAVNPPITKPSAQNPIPDVGVSAEPDYTFALALAAAQQLANASPVLTTPDRSMTGVLGRGPTSDGTGVSDVAGFDASVTPPSVPGNAPEAIQVIDLSASSPSVVSVPVGGSLDPGASGSGVGSEASLVSGSGSAAFGAFAPDTGAGAVAFRMPSASGDGGVLQLWMTDTVTGQVTSLGHVGAGPAGGESSVVVMRFRYDGATIQTPTFMVTREPAGGSVVPTGPIVVQPPITPNPGPAP